MVPKFTPVADMTYTQAVAEIEEILRMMQADSLDIDLLAAYTRRATELLTECRRRLTDTDRELQSILNPNNN
ncbi:exodeoxyribonuclease VII small subunit [Muribaculum intestinale]|jgi:exodeoxyribonuclease VII small subunit|uniref:Exodeoxyribonuclease VII small subunit n=1 Tax=Muribaculum intestinale TaxID=1796646 RepID=A0A1B1S6D6_9BACT|nr:exodeoxyribonuclease VII small subunit [Muribaculum intestinale]ROS82597.1 exodeoxyribonuclease VII small subunit [Muribaculaceae bacterium Isolate-042 (Harlan)]ANU62362.1 exodeoxyribonuclease VII small subunit [Muribaculum intestinale]ASB37158.1 exodeoxyribonuclease VII small subunit [Muribaculum intestinale]PWB04620.1 exodeoxyribonuclease VII small subunit [Muribaculum intestinale]PWB12455.1 exodeoxyribonuclease VII small subunit [Muribaculum intestinale]